MKTKVMKDKDPNVKARWTIATLIVMLPVAAIYFTNLSVYTDILTSPHLKFTYENIGIVCVVLFYAATLLLIAQQKMLYWPLVNKNDLKKFDERQLQVRHRIYERSYRLFPIAFFLAWANTNVHNMHAGHILWAVMIGAFFAMPAVVAWRQKDSY